MLTTTRTRLTLALTALLAGAFGWTTAGQTPAPAIELISIATTGVPGGGQSFNPFLGNDRGPSHVSADNRLVTFVSASESLVAGDANGHQDVFVRDRQSGTTTLISRAPDGSQGNDDSGTPVISADGRFVAFASMATNLTPNDTNGMPDIFLRDLQLGTTVLVSAGTAGGPADNGGSNPAISADGRFVAFESASTNLTAEPDANAKNVDVFVRDVLNGTTTRVSLRPDGSVITGADSMDPSISADGRRVAFAVFDNSPNGPTPGQPANLHHGIYVRDLTANATILVSAQPDGSASPFHYNVDPVISGNGRYVSFTSFDDLDPDHPDTALEADGPLSDVFVRDLQTSTTTRVSLPFAGGPAEESGNGGTISDDGRYVAYVSLDERVRLRDRVAGTTVDITAPGGAAPDGPLGSASISPDGRFVYFEGRAANLVPNDTNGLVDAFLYSTAPIADLSLTLAASTMQPDANSDVTLTIGISNIGPSATTGVAVRVTLPKGLTYVSDNGGGAYANASGTWSIATLGAGSAALQIVVRFGNEPTVNVTAEVIASAIADPDSTPGNGNPAEDDQRSVILAANAADLSLDLVASTTAPPVNANVVLTANVTNAGPGMATGVAVHAPLPAGLTLVSAAPAGAFNTAAGVWTVGSLPSGGTSALTIVARVAGSAAMDVVAEVSASNQPDPDSTPNNGNAAEDDQKTVHLVPAAIGIVVNDAGAAVNPNDGRCTLIEAIVAANTDTPSGNAVGECAGGNGADTIHLRAITAPKDATGTRDEYRLSAVYSAAFGATGLPTISTPIAIDGGNAIIRRTGGPAFRLFTVDLFGALALNSVTIAGGLSAGATPGLPDTLGGGILNLGYLELNGSEIAANSASCNGGGIFSAGALLLRGSTLRSNTTGCSGGGLATLNAGSVTVVDTTIQLNSADAGSGGGAIIHGTTTATVSNSVIDGNRAKLDGGGLLAHNADANVAFLNTRITSNVVNAGHGGGISNGRLDATGTPLIAGGTMAITTSIVSNNQTSGGNGSGIASAGPLTIGGTTIADNQIAGGGPYCGGIYNGNRAAIDASLVTNNFGGGVCSIGLGPLSVTGTTISDNRGGGVSLFFSPSATFLNSAIVRNSGTLAGGIYGSATASLVVTNTTISENVSSAGGGALDVSAGTVATIDGGSIVQNWGPAGGIHNAARVSLRNTILAANLRLNGAISECTTAPGATWTQAFNIVGQDPGCPLFTQIDADPFSTSGTIDPLQVYAILLDPLADNGGPTPTHALRPGSLAIDAGDFTCAAAIDQRGQPRPADGDGDGGARCDIGAVEQQTPLQAPPAAIASVSPASALAGGTSLTLTVRGSGFTAGSVLSWNGAPRTTFVASPTRLAIVVPTSDLVAPAGIQAISIAVTNPGGPASNVVPFTIVSANVAQVQSRIVPPGSTATTAVIGAPAQSSVSATFTNGNPGSGAAVVSVATYGTNPVANTIFAAGGVFDVQITGADASDSATARFYYPNTITGILEAGLALRYWTGTAWAPVLGSGGADPLKDQSDNLDGTISGGRFSVTLDATSTPAITDLGGTIFALFSDAAAGPRTKATQNPPANEHGWNNTAVTVALAAAEGSAALTRTEYSIDGGSWRVYRSAIRIPDEGVHVLTFRSQDAQGRVEAPQTLKVRIDRTPPRLDVDARPRLLWPAKDQLVDVETRVDVDDRLSGDDGFTLVSVISREVGIRRTSESSADIVGWEVGSPDTRGRLRAAADGHLRVYTLTYRGIDRAGNSRLATVEVFVVQ